MNKINFQRPRRRIVRSTLHAAISSPASHNFLCVAIVHRPSGQNLSQFVGQWQFYEWPLRTSIEHPDSVAQHQITGSTSDRFFPFVSIQFWSAHFIGMVFDVCFEITHSRTNTRAVDRSRSQSNARIPIFGCRAIAVKLRFMNLCRAHKT